MKPHQTTPNRTHPDITRPEWFGVICTFFWDNRVFGVIWVWFVLEWFVKFYWGLVRSVWVCFGVVWRGLVIGRTLQNSHRSQAKSFFTQTIITCSKLLNGNGSRIQRECMCDMSSSSWYIGCCGRFGRGASLYRHRSQLFGRLWVRLPRRPGSFLIFNFPPIMYGAVGSLVSSWSWTRQPGFISF